ncbi:MAG: Mrp/NBP35 family ATP-binding protein [Deltaproteobacteria bacterium]|nr:Mrp/NBP35 family ATP-binding protein [Deltaproteobacteria bacterium]
MPTPHEILEQLKRVKYPGYSRDIVSFGLVKDIEVASAGVTVTLAPTTANTEVLQQIRGAVEQTVTNMGVPRVEVVVTAPERAQPRAAQGRAAIPGVRHVVAVASGKGGVGKSTVAVNLALALASLGWRVGLLDADVYGPSVPLMLGLRERPSSTDDKRIIPLEKFGLKVISLGLFVEERTPIIWRGPMITKLLTQFLREVAWGELDVLVLDLPPGTGDAQLTIVQQVQLSGGVIVTTPQDVALLDVTRGVNMFQQVNAPVLGVIENMSYHICPGCGERAELFGHGGGRKMAQQFEVPFLGELPLVREIREHSDSGEPIVVAEPQHPQSEAFRAIAQRLAGELERQGAATSLPAIH